MSPFHRSDSWLAASVLAFLLCMGSARAQGAVGERWARTHGGPPTSEDFGWGLARSHSGRIAVCGKSSDPSVLPPSFPVGDLELVVHDSDGTRLWSVRYAAPLAGPEVPAEVRFGPQNEVFVVGHATNPQYTVQQGFLLRFTPDGSSWWVRDIGAPGLRSTVSCSAFLPDGDLVVGGTDGANPGNLSVQRRRPDTGDLVWAWSFDGGAGGLDEIRDIAVTPAGDVYVAGQVVSPATHGDVVLARLDGANGLLRWIRTFDGGMGGPDDSYGLALDGLGRPYVVGRIRTASGFPAAILAYDDQGSPRWSRTFAGSANLPDSADDILLDPLGRLVTCGRIENLGTHGDVVVWTHDLDGNLLSSVTWNSARNDDDNPQALTCDEFGNVSVSVLRYEDPVPSDADGAVVSWDASGTLRWVYERSGPGYQELLGLASAAGDVFVSGSIQIAPLEVDFLVARLGTDATPICLGDGTGAPCPCGNEAPSGTPVGCRNSLGVGGRLVGLGSASLSADTLVLVGSGMPDSTVLYIQGTSTAGAGSGTPFGDGVRCVGGTILRLGVAANVAGASSLPQPGGASLSSRGQITSPGSRVVQAWYRNAANYCMAAPFNLTNGLLVVWRT